MLDRCSDGEDPKENMRREREGLYLKFEAYQFHNSSQYKPYSEVSGVSPL